MRQINSLILLALLSVVGACGGGGGSGITGPFELRTVRNPPPTIPCDPYAPTPGCQPAPQTSATSAEGAFDIDSTRLVRTFAQDAPGIEDTWQINRVGATALTKPLLVQDVIHKVVSADINADGFQDLVSWERDGSGRRLVLHLSNEESNPAHTIALYADDQAVDQNADLLLLWREGHPFPSLVSSAGIHPNLDGRLSEPLLPQAWSGSDPVQFAGEDLNRDGFDDVLYFPAEEAAWFAVVLSQGDGSFGIPETYLEPAGVRAITVADIDLDGQAEVIVMGNMHLVQWESR